MKIAANWTCANSRINWRNPHKLKPKSKRHQIEDKANKRGKKATELGKSSHLYHPIGERPSSQFIAQSFNHYLQGA